MKTTDVMMYSLIRKPLLKITDMEMWGKMRC